MSIRQLPPIPLLSLVGMPSMIGALVLFDKPPNILRTQEALLLV
jgi:hypothetical protein